MANPDGVSCEFAITVADSYQRRGVAYHLMTALIERARATGMQRMYGHILAENMNMITLAQTLGFTVEHDPEDGSVLRAALVLSAGPH
jgi:acetyltransferase